MLKIATIHPLNVKPQAFDLKSVPIEVLLWCSGIFYTPFSETLGSLQLRFNIKLATECYPRFV